MSAHTGTATVLFTDLVGSTALRTALGEERTDLLRRTHDVLLEQCVTDHGGVVVKGGGDGIMATFDAAAHGVAAAVAMQQVIARHNARPDRLAELSVRIGLSTGDVTWEGGDCFGLTVVEAARLEAAAEGGQILCSELVRLMARGRGGHQFEPIGFLELKGLPEPLAVCAVDWQPSGPTDHAELPFPAELAIETHGATFVGRQAALGEVLELLDVESPARGAVAWLLGEPGIGKTRLAAEIATRAHDRGAAVLFGRCSEDLKVPYQPFLEALRSTLTLVADEPAAVLGPSAGELVRLLPEIGERFADLRPTASSSVEVEQYRLFEATRSWLATMSAERPVVFVVDDLQWAGPQTLQLLGHVARAAEASRVLFVCTARDTAPDANDALADLVTDLQRGSTPSRTVQLGGLDRDEVATLVASSIDDAKSDFVGRLHRDTAGNPLFVTTVLDAYPVWTADHGDRLPGSIQELVRRRLRALPDELTALLQVAALAGLEFDLPVVAQAAQLDEEVVLDHLERARRAGLAVETGFDRYRFTHALVRATLRAELSDSRRVRSHLRLGRALAPRHPERLQELAHHFWEARAAGAEQEAFEYCRAAADRAAELHSYRDAADLYARALDVAPAAWGAGLQLARGVAEHDAGELITGLSLMLDAAARARAAGQTELLATIALVMETLSWPPAAFSQEVADLCREALETTPAGSDLGIRLRASMARALAYTGRANEVVSLARQALADAEAAGDETTIAHCVIRLGLNTHAWFDAALVEDIVVRLRQISDGDHDDQVRLHAINLLLLLLTRVGRLDELRARIPAYRARAAPLRQAFWKIGPVFYECGAAFASGDLAGTERWAHEASALNDALQSGDRSGVDGVRTFQLRREQGRLDEIEPALRMLLRLHAPEMMWQPGLAATAAALGWHDEARTILDRIDVRRLPEDSLRELALCFLAEAVDDVGGHPIGQAVFAALDRSRGLNVIFGHGLLSPGPIDRLLGVLAAVAGRRDEAEQLFRDALEQGRAMHAPLYVAHALADWGRWRLRWGDEPGAAPLLAEARLLAERHRLGGLGRRLDRLAASER